MKVGLLGAGAWGGTMGKVAERCGSTVLVHEFDSPGWSGSFEALLLAIPVQFIRKTLKSFPDPGVPVLSLSKGLEIGTDCRVSEIIREIWPKSVPAALSGPTFAAEIARGLPGAAVVASEVEKVAAMFQDLLHGHGFRLYRSSDLIGVEMGGALKNVYAVSGGLCTGMRLGDTARAGLLTRCLAEMARLGILAGGRPETFAGLSGVGDLLLTATSEQSRNFRVGLMLASGKNLETILKSLGGVAEGVSTAKALYMDSKVPQESKPVATQIYRILYEDLPLEQAVKNLLERAKTSE